MIGLWKALRFKPDTLLYFGLWLQPIGPNDNGNHPGEVSTPEYKRATSICAEWKTDNGVISNSEFIRFPDPASSWGAPTHCAILDKPQGGNVLFWIKLLTPLLVRQTDKLYFNPGDVTIDLDKLLKPSGPVRCVLTIDKQVLEHRPNIYTTKESRN